MNSIAIYDSYQFIGKQPEQEAKSGWRPARIVSIEPYLWVGNARPSGMMGKIRNHTGSQQMRIKLHYCDRDYDSPFLRAYEVDDLLIICSLSSSGPVLRRLYDVSQRRDGKPGMEDDPALVHGVGIGGMVSRYLSVRADRSDDGVYRCYLAPVVDWMDLP